MKGGKIVSRFDFDVKIKMTEIVKAILEEIDDNVEIELSNIDCDISDIMDGEKRGNIEKLKERYNVVKTAYRNLEHYIGSLV